MSLLISNGIRRDTASIVGVGGKWIIAPGDRVRHLRPDADTSEGWVRAVLRGKRLGAILLEEPPILDGVTVLLHEGEVEGGELSTLYDASTPIVLCYTSSSVEDCSGRVEGIIRVPDWGYWRTAIIANIILDNSGGGLC